MGTGPTLHTRASLALVGGVGWKGMRPGCARTSGSRCLQVGHTLAECKGDIVCNSCGKTGHLAVYAQTAHTPREWLRAWLKRSPSRPFQTVSPDAPLIAPVSDTSAPVEVFQLPFVFPPRPWRKLPLRPRLPACPLGGQDKTAEMVLAEWHAEQDAACTGSPVATPAIGDTVGLESTGPRDIKWPRFGLANGGLTPP
ncbi:hypothetical protein BSL78_08982 [Apostichopus japonicus]|uniref:CCHC-type domain-containing protein n=1 Tax=Stichopus japonicus TaxID=307972 RepID=A0A2G8L1L1_STIJA|nr:hypothetical protein BSL78_08982 [Apostichopus japonicus]